MSSSPSHLFDLIGETVLSFPSGPTSTPTPHSLSTLRSSTTLLLLYHSGGWCPSCRQFTPDLLAFYKNSMDKGYSFDIIFISADEDEESMRDYGGNMPWKVMRWEGKREEVSSMMGIKGVPQVVVVRSDTGEVVSLEGRKEIVKEKEKIWAKWGLSEGSNKGGNAAVKGGDGGSCCCVQ